MTNFQWADAIRDSGLHLKQSAKEFLEGQTLGQFFIVWCKSPKVSKGEDMESIRAKINRRRRELGMEPMKPEERKPVKKNGK